MTKQDKLKALTFAARVRSHATDVEAMTAKLRETLAFEQWSANGGSVPLDAMGEVAGLFALIQQELLRTCGDLREFAGEAR
jgi:hypothetical protein